VKNEGDTKYIYHAYIIGIIYVIHWP